MNLTDLFRKTPKNFQLEPRHLNPKYIRDNTHRQHYIEYGYVIIPDCVDNAIIDRVITTHKEISQMPGYFESNELQTTIAFGEDIHSKAIRVIKEISEPIFNRILDPEHCRYDFGGGIIVKNKGCWFAPHQDCSIIDEYKGTTTYAWIPTVDMTDDNGTFYLIPGSHRWAAWQRSSQYPSWPLKKFSKFLWNQMEPIYVTRGDILLFDSALIHASGENKTNEIRLAFNACIIERTAQHVQYVQGKDTPKGKIEKYFVDDEFWYKGSLFGRPQGYRKEVESVRYPQPLTRRFLKEQIEKFYTRA